MDSSSPIKTFDLIDVLELGYGTSIVQAGITSGAGSMT